MIEQFVRANPFEFDTAELQIVRGWKCAVAGSFYVFRYLKQHTVFLSIEGQPRAYGVLALADPMVAIIGPHAPVLAQTVLLPFLDKIVYDGLIACYPISFGGGIKRMLNDTYKKAKAKHGIITSLPLGCQEPQPEDEPESVIVKFAGPKTTLEVQIGEAVDSGTFALRLTRPQRRGVARLLPELTSRLLLDTANQRSLRFTLDEIEKIAQRCQAAVSQAPSGMERNSLRLVIEAAEQSIGNCARH